MALFDIFDKAVKIGSLGLVDGEDLGGLFGFGPTEQQGMPKAPTEQSAQKRVEQEQKKRAKKGYTPSGYSSTMVSGAGSKVLG
jgi:hypothetical protein